MALSFCQTPNELNATDTHLVYSAASTCHACPSYSTKFEICHGSDKVFSGAVFPNVSGYSIFDIGSITSTLEEIHLDFDVDVCKRDLVQVDVEATESYLASANAASLTEGDTCCDTLYLLSAHEEVGLNYYTDDIYTNSNANNVNNAITPFTSREITINRNDYYTIGVLNRCDQSVTEVQVNVGGTCSRVALCNDTTNKLYNIGLAPSNINAGSLNIDFSSVDSYEVTVFGRDTENTDNIATTYIEKYKVNLNDEDTIQFMWDRGGALQYYNFPNEVSVNTQHTRETINLQQVDYSSTDGSVTYDATGSGKQVVNHSKLVTKTYSTELLGINDDIDAIQTIFEAKNVWRIDNGSPIPVVITDTSVESFINPRNQREFRVTITTEESNQ